MIFCGVYVDNFAGRIMEPVTVPRVLGELIEDRVKRNGDKVFFRFSNCHAHAFRNLG